MLTAGTCPLNLSNIVFFATGLKDLSPAGFNPKPSIEFLHDNEADGRQSTYPKAHTCSCCLQLPVVHNTYELFVEAIVSAMKNAEGFGYACIERSSRHIW